MGLAFDRLLVTPPNPLVSQEGEHYTGRTSAVLEVFPLNGFARAVREVRGKVFGFGRGNNKKREPLTGFPFSYFGLR